MKLVKSFLKGLKEYLPPEELEELYKTSDIAKENLGTLRSHHPNCPESLLISLKILMARTGENMARCD